MLDDATMPPVPRAPAYVYQCTHTAWSGTVPTGCSRRATHGEMHPGQILLVYCTAHATPRSEPLTPDRREYLARQHRVTV